MPEKITATFQIITPMFLGGAGSDELADTIRPPSVKGAIRFWWRALQWGRFRATTSCDDAALALLHDREAQLFGLATSSKTSGQGRFLIHSAHASLRSLAKGMVHTDFAKFSAPRYLGYGLMSAFSSNNTGVKAGQLNRPCISEKQEFSIILRFRNEFEPSIKEALIAWGLIGGLGSRSRHGMGSVALQEIKQNGQIIWNSPRTREQYIEEVSRLMTAVNCPSELPPYTAFSAMTRIDVLKNIEPTPFSAMNTFATGLMMYRSWGKDGKVLGQDREGNFKPDHDWSYNTSSDSFHPRRVVFGLPHNYGKEDTLKIVPVHHDRRASPLLFHVHAVDYAFIGVSIFFPAKFLPESELLNAGGTCIDPNIEWSVITDFLDGNRKSDDQPRFSNKTTIVASGR